MRKAPLLIRLFSYFFIFMGVVALGTLVIAWLSPNESSKLNISFLTNRFIFTEHPILFTVTSLFFVFSGIIGLAIVLKRSFAYDLGIVYCVIGLIFFSTLIISRIGLINDQIMSLIIQGIIFGGFLIYLVRHRSKWKNG